MNLEKEILNAVDSCLEKLTNEFVQNPIRFFSEKDFHWYFCYLLNKKLIEDGILNKNELIETSFPSENEQYRTMIVHQEYGTIKGQRNQIDVVVLDPIEVKEINDLDLKRNGKFLRPLVAIEFGTEKTADLPTHIESDCQKLVEAEAKNGYVVICYRDRTKSTKGSRFQKHSNKVNEIIKKIKKVSKKEEYKKLRIIAVIYHIFRRECEIHKYKDGERIERNGGPRDEEKPGRSTRGVKEASKIEMKNANQIINDSIKSTLFGKFYEPIVLGWFKEKKGFSPLEGKPRVYWEDVEFNRADSELARKLSKNLKCFKKERKYCLPDGFLKKEGKYYIWEAKNWPMWSGSMSPQEQLKNILVRMPQIISTKATYRCEKYNLGGTLFSWWSRFEGIDKILKEINKLSPHSFEMFYTSEVLEDCIASQYPWYIEIIKKEKARIEEFFKDLISKSRKHSPTQSARVPAPPAP